MNYIIPQKSAWFMLQRLREACGNDPTVLRGFVEIDEMYVGGKEANKHKGKKLNAGRGAVGKTAVLGAMAAFSTSAASRVVRRSVESRNGELPVAETLEALKAIPQTTTK